VVKDEPPDAWDGDEEEEEVKKVKVVVKPQVKPQVKVQGKEKDLEYLFQEVQRDESLDEFLMKDLQSKRMEPKYQEMLVRIYLLCFN
jgi:hypothetical protein